MANEDVKTPIAEPSAAEPNTTLTPSIREQWNKDHLPKTENSATPDAPKAAKSEVKTESATESETVKEPQEKGSKKLTADERIAQLEATIEKIRKSSGKSEPKQVEETKAEPVTRQPVEVKPQVELKAPVKPKVQDFESWEAFEEAKDKYNEDLAEFKAKKAVQEDRQAQLQQQQMDKVAKEFSAAEEKYEGYKEKTQPLIDALIAEMQAEPAKKTIHPVILEAIGSNPLCADILYVLGPQKDEFLALAKSYPIAALEKVAVIKHLISEEFAAKAKTEAAEPKEPKEVKEEKKTPVETVTRAPKPPSEVGGRATTADDEGQQAAKSGDFRSAKAAWTRDYVASNK